MAKTYLTLEERKAAEVARQNDVFARAVRRYRADTGKMDRDLASAVGVTAGTITRWKNPDEIGKIMNKVRLAAHEAKMSKEDWLKFGGYV